MSAEWLAYTALFFNLLGLVTGILFFIWAVGGLSLSLGLMPKNLQYQVTFFKSTVSLNAKFSSE